MTVRWIDIDLDAYRRNLTLVRDRVAPAKVMPVVKNNAYGHGITQIVSAAVAEGVTAIGVLDASVGIQLRESGVPDSVILFAWLFAPDEQYSQSINAQIDLGVSTIWQLQAIVSDVQETPARIHLKIDTGLGRAGARPDEWPALIAAARAAEKAGAVIIVGAWTHIAEASHEEDSASIELFHSAVNLLGERRNLLRHLAASAASYSRADSRFELVRVGAFTYGIAPGDGVSPEQLGLSPVMALRGVVTAVSDDGTAIVPIGLTDGLLSLRGAELEASVGGERVPVMSIDATTTTVGAPHAAIGDVVTFFGSAARGEPTLQEWADSLGTIGEEIVSRLTTRIERRVSGAGL
jgi:alanine racemase